VGFFSVILLQKPKTVIRPLRLGPLERTHGQHTIDATAARGDVIDLTTLSGPTGATLVVGVIFVQALALYAGYAVLERVLPPLVETATST